MKNLTLSLGRLAVVLAGALSLGACNRSEYAFLPRSASYLGSTPVARQRAVAAPTQATPAVAPAESAVVTAPAVPAAAPETLVAIQPAPAAAAPAPVALAPLAAPAVSAAPAAKPAATPKLNLVQRLALRKITKKLDKLTAQAPQLKKHDATASTSRLDGNLRTGILLILLGLVISLLGFISGIFGVIGAIIAIIGLVFIILWLLDEL